jgi:hypothetical protein
MHVYHTSTCYMSNQSHYPSLHHLHNAHQANQLHGAVVPRKLIVQSAFQGIIPTSFMATDSLLLCLQGPTAHSYNLARQIKHTYTHLIALRSILISFIPKCPKEFLPFRFSEKCFFFITFQLTHACHTPNPSHSLWYAYKTEPNLLLEMHNLNFQRWATMRTERHSNNSRRRMPGYVLGSGVAFWPQYVAWPSSYSHSWDNFQFSTQFIHKSHSWAVA